MLLFTAVTAIFLVISVDASVVKRQTNECPDTCRGKPMEISFVVDSSASIWPVNYTEGLWFIQNFVDKFNIGPSEVRVSVVTYGDRVYEEDAIDFDDYTDKTELKEAIKNLRHRAGSSTQTGAGIRHMLDNQLPQARQGVRKVIIVLTDGNSQQPEITKAEAKRALDAGLEVFAIGVGLNISASELHNIASDDKHVFPVGTYRMLNDIMDKLIYETCNVTTEPVCRHDFVDIAFVIDSSSSIGEDNFILGLEFIKEFLSGFTINPSSTRVAAVMFGYTVYSESAIPFDAYNNEKETVDAILALKWMFGNRTDTGLGIDYMVANFFPYFRPHVAHIGIVITDGDSQNGTKTKESAEIARTTDDLKMYAVGVGSVSQKELLNIAGDTTRVLTASDYVSLNTIKNDLTNLVCEAHMNPTGHNLCGLWDSRTTVANFELQFTCSPLNMNLFEMNSNLN